MIFIVILADIRLRISVDLRNYINRRTILCSIDWSQIQVRLWTKNWGGGQKPCKIPHCHKNPSRHSLENVGWLSKIHQLTQNFMFYRLVTDSREVVDQKLGFGPEKPYKIHDFHRNPCRHSLENPGWPSKLYWSTQNFMFYRLVTDSSEVVD